MFGQGVAAGAELIGLANGGPVLLVQGNDLIDPSARCEKMIADLKLDEKQAVEFRKLQKEYMEKAQKEREAMKAEREKQREKMLAMREDKNAQMKKILTEEQYKQYLEKQQPKGNKHGRKHLGNGRR